MKKKSLHERDSSNEGKLAVVSKKTRFLDGDKKNIASVVVEVLNLLE